MTAGELAAILLRNPGLLVEVTGDDLSRRDVVRVAVRRERPGPGAEPVPAAFSLTTGAPDWED
jgi:hypothetical protein